MELRRNCGTVRLLYRPSLMNRSAVLVFPPNWTACVNSPHLALPLIAGAAKTYGWHCETFDLSEYFYRTYGRPPARENVVSAASNQRFKELDKLYFDWEDQFRSHRSSLESGNEFGLLSGYSFAGQRTLKQTLASLTEGTIYSRFINNDCVPQLAAKQPDLVGVTIASQEQLLPSVQLLFQIRQQLPNAFLLLGGNIVTRLRGTSAFETLCSLVDQVVLFQGDRSIIKTLQAIDADGISKARRLLPKIVADESIPYEQWPLPDFAGIAFDKFVGIPSLSYVSTRGCYWGKCHFCAIPAGWSTRGYAGSAPGDFVAEQLFKMVAATGIRRIKFVDEAVPPAKIDPLSHRLRELNLQVEWEGYARLESAWEDSNLLERAHAGGLRKLYFGLEQAPSTDRLLLGKNDRGNMMHILHACRDAGIKVHLFCMVGHPRSSRTDAIATVDFLVENEALIDTADLVGFRLDRGTRVAGVRPVANQDCDWAMSLKYEPTESGVLSMAEVDELEFSCQEALWENVPRLLHPLYRIATSFGKEDPIVASFQSPLGESTCSNSSLSMR